MIPKDIKKRLPKANLFYVKRHTGKRFKWAKFRLANAMFVWIGPFEIGWRMPWLERPARQLYPDWFKDSTQ